MPATFKDLVLDAGDHQKLADWWCAAMGYRRKDELEPPEGGWVRPRDWPVPIVDPDGKGPLFWIVPVPEPKTVKNRVHLDLHAGGGPGVPVEEQRTNVRAAVSRLESLGAHLVEEREELGVVWAVMTDPEGNEFCA